MEVMNNTLKNLRSELLAYYVWHNPTTRDRAAMKKAFLSSSA